jgi:hypothetical protein
MLMHVWRPRLGLLPDGNYRCGERDRDNKELEAVPELFGTSANGEWELRVHNETQIAPTGRHPGCPMAESADA